MAKTLELQDMADPRYVPHIAQKLQRLHSLLSHGHRLPQLLSSQMLSCAPALPHNAHSPNQLSKQLNQYSTLHVDRRRRSDAVADHLRMVRDGSSAFL